MPHLPDAHPSSLSNTDQTSAPGESDDGQSLGKFSYKRFGREFTSAPDEAILNYPDCSIRPDEERILKGLPPERGPFATTKPRCNKEKLLIPDKNNSTFDPAAFLASAGLGRRIVKLEPRETFFSQGDPTDSVFYLQSGRAKLTVVSQFGKEATITLLSSGDFVGEESLAAVVGLRLATATAVNTCTALKIARDEMIRVMHDEPAFADMFLKFLLTRSMRTQADLVDQLFNSSEKRLARILLIMAEFGKPGEQETFIPPITQETLADMIGTTRSRVSFFMNRFRKLGFISYDGRIQVHKSLLNVVLLDQLPGHNSQKPDLSDLP